MPTYSSAGKTFTNAKATKKFGAANARQGALGESYFAKQITKHCPGYHTWGSLRTPARKGEKVYESDIDFVIANGNTVILVDVKRWAGRVTYWAVNGYPFKGLAPLKRRRNPNDLKSEVWKPLSRNMAMAQDRVSRELPGCRVIAMTIFVPTSNGALPNSVRFLTWPDGIKSYLVGDGITKIMKILGKPGSVDPNIVRVMNSLRQ